MTASKTEVPSRSPVAFVGLGKMGFAMASNLQRAGYPLVVWNRSVEKAAPLRAGGARVAASPAEAAQGAKIVFTSLADDASAREVVLGADGVVSGLRRGAIHVGTSTVSPGLTDEFSLLHASSGARYLAGPVVGRVPEAEAAALLTFVAGDAAAVEEARGVITAYAPRMVAVGECQSQAIVAKLIANFLGVSGMDLIGQSIGWAEKAGLPPAVVPMILAGFFGAQATRDYIPKIGNHDFDDVGFTTSGGLKDVNLMIDAARDVGQQLSSAVAVRGKLEAALALGWRDKDWSCFTEVDR